MRTKFKTWLSENCYGNYNGIEITPETEVVAYTYVISIGIMSFKRSTQYYFKEVERGERIFAKIFCILINLVLGWWGIPWGPIWTIKETVCDLTNYYTTTWGAVTGQPYEGTQKISSEEIITDYKKELDLIKENFAKHPYLDQPLRKPDWMKDTDELSGIFDESKELFRIGEIHYGYIVQANKYLFQETPDVDCPANILYSLDYKVDKNPEILAKAADLIYSYKNTEDAPDYLKEIVAYVTDEYDRAFNIRFEVELEDSSKVTLYFTTVMIFRDHLPGRVLQGELLPVITYPTMVKTVMVLPKQYWTENFTKEYER